MLRHISVNFFLIACILKHGIVSMHKRKRRRYARLTVHFLPPQFDVHPFFNFVTRIIFFVCSLLLSTHQAANLITRNKHSILLL
jgi:hypothetical protein